jgi:hypothetical protein
VPSFFLSTSLDKTCVRSSGLFPTKNFDGIDVAGADYRNPARRQNADEHDDRDNYERHWVVRADAVQKGRYERVWAIECGISCSYAGSVGGS